MRRQAASPEGAARSSLRGPWGTAPSLDRELHDPEVTGAPLADADANRSRYPWPWRPCGRWCRLAYLRCRARCEFILNIVTLSLPKTGLSLASAMISRLFSGFWSLCFLM